MTVGKLLVVTLFLVWSVTTVSQVFRWGHPLHLWRQAIEESPNKPRPWNNLGAHYLLDRAEYFAIECFQRSTRLAQHPDRSYSERASGISVAQTNLALLEAQRGEYDRALARLTPVMNLYKLQETIAAHAWITRQKTIASQ
jgi:hypothetical protein